MKLLENLEKAGIQEAGVASQDAAGAAGNRKEKNGLLNDYTATEAGVGYLHRVCPVSLTPNSETPRLAWLGPWSMELAGTGRARGSLLTGNVIHKIDELAIDFHDDSLYSRDRNRV